MKNDMIGSLDELLVLLILRGPKRFFPGAGQGWLRVSTLTYIAALDQHCIRMEGDGAYCVTPQGRAYIENKYPETDLEQLLVAFRI